VKFVPDRFNAMIRPRGHVFYGWRIVLAAAGVQWFSAFLWMSSYGAYVVLLEAEFEWSKAVLSGAFALTRIESGLLGPLQGWMVDRYGPVPVLRVGIVLFGIGFMLFSQIQTLWQFYTTFVLIALGTSLGGYATLMVSLVNWFDRYRATSISLSQLGYSMGGLCIPLLALALETWGWRVVSFGSGIVVLLIGLPLVQMVRHRPEEIGEVPDGIDYAHPDAPAAPRVQVQFTAREAMRTASFWLISIGHALALLIVSAVMVHLIPHLTDGAGYSLVMASQVVLLLTLFQIVGQLLGGWAGDRVSKRWVCAACMVAHTAGLLLVTYFSGFMAVLAFCVLHGLAWGVRGPMMVAIRADYFGTEAFGTIMGFSSLVVMFGMSGGPIVAGIMADVYGNYTAGFTLLACLALSGGLCFIAARAPAPPVRAGA
jgi:sugar phosphate permease